MNYRCTFLDKDLIPRGFVEAETREEAIKHCLEEALNYGLKGVLNRYRAPFSYQVTEINRGRGLSARKL